jgi:hypothetical protein
MDDMMVYVFIGSLTFISRFLGWDTGSCRHIMTDSSRAWQMRHEQTNQYRTSDLGTETGVVIAHVENLPLPPSQPGNPCFRILVGFQIASIAQVKKRANMARRGVRRRHYRTGTGGA